MLISGYGNLGRNGFARCDTRFGSGAGTAVAASYVSQHVNRCMSDQSPELADKKSTSGWKFAIRALRHRNYLLFFSGQTVSLIGTWMTRIATAWLVYRLTHSAFLLGSGRILRPDPGVSPGTVRRSPGGPLEPPSRAGRYPNSLHGAVVCFGRPRVESSASRSPTSFCSACSRAQSMPSTCPRGRLSSSRWSRNGKTSPMPLHSTPPW